MARRQRILLFSVLAIAVGGVGAWYTLQGTEPVRAARSANAGAVPVTVAAVSKRDLPIYLTGLGAVQASFTVGIRSQVDGKLETGHVHRGAVRQEGRCAGQDRSAPVSRRALDQAKAKKAQDDAKLISAQKDLERSRTLVAKELRDPASG